MVSAWWFNRRFFRLGEVPDREPSNSNCMNSVFFKTPRLKLALASTLYGMLIYSILPAQVVALNDDFSYLKSVMLTLQRHRPWTDAWLEPWGASFVWVSAFLFRLTRNLLFSTYGLLALLAAVSFQASCRLWMEKQVSTRGAILATALLMTFPTMLWKSLEFTAVALYLPCLLLTIDAANRKQWFWFAVVWMIAASNRQSAVAWLTFPAVACLEVARTKPRQSWQTLGRLALIIAAGLAFIVFMSAIMNKTHSQRVRTDHVFEMIQSAKFFHAFGTSLIVFIGSAGLGRVMLWTAGILPVAGKLWSPGRLLGWIALGSLLAFVDLRTLVSPEHPLFSDHAGWWYIAILTLLSGTGWLMGGFTVRPAFALTALASALLVAIRGSWWDYYFLDPLILGLFGIAPTQTNSSGAAWPRKSLLIILPLIALHLSFIWKIKLHVDQGSALCLLYEKSMREGTIDPSDMRSAPFGLAAWHLFPYFVTTRKGKKSPSIGGLICHLRQRSVVNHISCPGLVNTSSWPFEDDPPAPAAKIASHSQRLGWFFTGTYSIWKLPESPESLGHYVPVMPMWRFTPFPLNESEWKDLSQRTDGQF